MLEEAKSLQRRMKKTLAEAKKCINKAMCAKDNNNIEEAELYYHITCKYLDLAEYIFKLIKHKENYTEKHKLEHKEHEYINKVLLLYELIAEEYRDCYNKVATMVNTFKSN